MKESNRTQTCLASSDQTVENLFSKNGRFLLTSTFQTFSTCLILPMYTLTHLTNELLILA